MTQLKVQFTTNRYDAEIIRKIAARAVAMGREHGIRLKNIDVEMDISATNANGCPLRLDELLAADDFNFMHDVLGIRRHLNRNTGKLEGFFDPRFSRPEP